MALVSAQAPAPPAPARPRLDHIRASLKNDLVIRKALHVKVIRGRKLRDTDYFNKMDPYVAVKYGSNVSTSLAQRHAGTECKFDWSATFPFDPGASGPSLELLVMDQNIWKSDVEVGRADVDFFKLTRARTEPNAFRGSVPLTWKRLKREVEEPAGELDVEFWWEDFFAADGFPIPAKYCISNYNIGGGLVRSVLDGVKLTPFQTWQMNLWMVDTVFRGLTCGWNKKYEAAIKIYGEGMQASAVRKAIRVQHSLLYSSDKTQGFYDVKLIRSTRDFLDMLPKANEGTGKSFRFTYVILEDSHMHFSRTSKKIATDMLSKHAIHACAKRQVVYAGEFFVDTKSKRSQQSQQPALIIDNNSGTFAPPKERLPMLKLLLELNLGTDVPIFALDRNDPFLKECFEENNVQ